MTIIGIDLGTVNSVVAVAEGGSPRVLANAEGDRTTPSVVAYKGDEILVGEPAKRQQITNPSTTVFAAKRLIGMQYDQIKGEADKLSYAVGSGDDGRVIITVNDKKVTPEEVGSKVLQKLKDAAEKALGEKVTQAVITVPAYFDNAQRQATKDAGTIAGLEVLRVINEPTAAALAYGMDKKEEQRVLVIDCGGGTTDISLLDVGDGVVEVVATSGDTHLGGEDFDSCIVDYLADEFKAAEGVDLRQDKMALQRLKTEAEKAKKELSATPQVEVNIPFITATSEGPKHLQAKLTRAKFEDMTADLVKRIFVCADNVLRDAKMSSEDIDEVVFVGGSTRMPVIAAETKARFGKDPNQSVNPDEIVAMGAAVQGSILAGDQQDILLLDVTSLSLGIETLGQVMTTLIPRNTTIPSKKSQVFSTAADNQTSVTVKVAQGERPMFGDNQELATFNLDGIPPAPRGVPQIEVTFDIDANGIVNVSAKDMATGKDKNVTIKSGLSSDEIETMIKDAEEHAEADKRRLNEIEKMNQLDSLVLSTSKTLSENKESLGDQVDVEALEEALEAARRVLEDRSMDKAEETIGKLTEHAHKMAEVLYAKAQAESVAEQAATDQEPVGEEEVIDVGSDS